MPRTSSKKVAPKSSKKTANDDFDPLKPPTELEKIKGQISDFQIKARDCSVDLNKRYSEIVQALSKEGIKNYFPEIHKTMDDLALLSERTTQMALAVSDERRRRGEI